MNLIQASLQAILPAKRKTTTGGWISFNAVCCLHRGEGKDTKKRGGIHIHGEGFTYHCFNCGFKAGWTPGHNLSINTRQLFKWLGLTDAELNKLVLESLKARGEYSDETGFNLDYIIKEKKLPDSCLPIKEWLQYGCTDTKLLDCVEYIKARGFSLDDYNWHWSCEDIHSERLIIPFYHEGKIAGWTGRAITNKQPRYITSSQPGYVFNIDRQTYDRKYLIVVEGQLDAIAVDGVGILHNKPNEVQCSRINSLDKEVIVVPDRDAPGAKMITAAINNDWNISLPPWGDDVKDVAEAMRRYGKLYTLAAIIHYKEHNKLKMELLKKKLESLVDKKKRK